jgi:hypothetical protein
VPTISFWVNWLRQDGQNACPQQLICIIRAISWVESEHGHGSGSSASRDPMQVGNPQDTAWNNIGKNSSTSPGDRPIRQGSLTGYSWAQIPNVVNVSTLPYTIDPTFLPSDGHNNANFTQQMSYFWGIIWYFYSLQVATSIGAWSLGNCDPTNLISGAVQYNGGGDPNYGQKIKDALKMVCCSKYFNL